MKNYTEARQTLEDVLQYYTTGQLKVIQQEAKNGIDAMVNIDTIAKTTPDPFNSVLMGRDERTAFYPSAYFSLLREICTAIIEEREFNEQLEAGTITMNQNQEK